jgi:hypothetical protein
MLTTRECASANFAKFMQTHGFQMASKACLDGPFNSVDWTNAGAFNSAIANVGPVKIGVASVNLTSSPHGKVTPGTSGWAIYGLPTGQPENHCASLYGYGPLATMVDLFKRNGVNLNLPSRMPTGLCYAMFSWGSIGIVDRTSLMNITSEAWVRNPTTIVKDVRDIQLKVQTHLAEDERQGLCGLTKRCSHSRRPSSRAVYKLEHHRCTSCSATAPVANRAR